ncbi:hypothetical protein L226DRAFT_547045 [Lentinus tigrinus ALCF2SS1-7]|uniref:Methyltransferase domain-containing protein n=1 Tax=Lentinus tigrinus ALCF2SS1-6 TaxID=1328759 RepID=A0A5C2S1P6_9APHY|nr:hypothetical protein L227DRAFT_587572 [Lentinus tigrinus ALCF2SS1-6]RPD71989.1 hypothetical protein L226DRAFT_547045 [Lentinus tigrinus ALCF2SS1-7]
MKKAIYGWSTAIPSSIDISGISEVLDVAAGTCVWTADFAQIPEVNARLALPCRPPVANPIQLSACDIETKFFPEQSFLDSLNIKTFHQDVTKPFPAELRGKYDIIHISFLLLCLTEQGWKDALKNVRDALTVAEPGGILFLDDADPVIYTEQSPPPPEDALSHDIPASLGAPGWQGKANRIYLAFALGNNFVVDLTFRLPSMLSAAGFTLAETKRGYATAGKLCHTFRGNAGDTWGFEDFSIENFVFIFEHLAPALLAKGELYQPDGTKVTSEQEMQAMLQEIRDGLRAGGAVSVGRYFIARKAGE